MGVASEDDKNWIVGVDDDEGPPVPIPNTEVKLISAEDTWLETAWENRAVPTLETGKRGETLVSFLFCFSLYISFHNCIS